MNEARSRPFALVAQLASEIDDLVERIEPLPLVIDKASQTLEDNVMGINAAVVQYRADVNAINLQIMKSIAEYAVRHTNDVATRTTDEMKKALQQCAHDAFETELSPHLKKLTEAMARIQSQSKSRWLPWAEHAGTAVAAMTALFIAMHFFHV